ncbi:restriction endonuclease subunit S [Flectobacillus major]|uniref:restriction endonuclease subunit S n=1 Tax=Flectobacillus major TaxID=103 RepID=UPI000421A133|nr:restriction endonuclease subunit S [Flectobacillus major]
MNYKQNIDKSHYGRIGDYIKLIDERNKGLRVQQLLGLSISKQFIPSVANIIGTDMENYKIIRKNQFACSTMQVRRDKKMPVALLQEVDEAIISQAYPIFEVKDETKLLPEYLMMWFTRSEFDREACFHAVGGVRGSLEWEDFENMQLPVPHIDKQREIVKEYNVIQNRIALNQQLIQKLEETAQAVYKQWFGEGVDLENLPEGWRVDKIKNICSKIGSGSTPTGGKESYFETGISLIRSTNVFDYNFSVEDLAFINDEQANKLKNVTVEKNDILFNITGVSVARCCMVPQNILPARVNQHVMIIRPFSHLSISFYLLLNLCSTDSKNILLGISQSGSTREAITKSEIEEFEIIIPQTSLLERFEGLIQKIFSAKDLKSLENQKLTELKDLLLSKLATVK